ncbi:MANSC domain-containing protein 4-like [Carassius auratus]|uniref:MANSC domain-containing protein 4-like n=1 Tax=Carassius auratus TaxID=7957 RepID=A0A6P6JBR1_CARAU|nr:MANSC domain-containing protein 4-like [Carassius auratus]
MTVPWSLLWILGLICSSDSSCSPTSYYKSCWIRRYPGLYVDIEESQRRGAHILKLYQEESAVKCSRACCLTRNFSCNLAVYHFNTTQDSVNCFHLQCPNLESCIPHHRGNVILYNVTKGVDPDLLVFGKYFTTNVRVLPHMSSSRLNVSEPLTSDKRQFNYPPNPPVRSISPASTSTKTPTTPQQTTRAVPTVHQVQQTLPRCTTTQDDFYVTGSIDKHASYDHLSDGYLTLSFTHTRLVNSATTSSLSSSLTAPTSSMVDSQPYPNDTKGYISRNITTGDAPQTGGDGGLMSVWHFAANTVLVSLATCATITFCCCCSVFVALSWRGRRRRKGRYRTNLRCKRGSMRLIKYVIVRESS